MYYYDPIEEPGDKKATYRNLAMLTYDEHQSYEKQRRTRLFAEKYKAFTGTEYLSLYPRSPPTHKMWRADHFGQKHWVSTKETHFTQKPPNDLLKNFKIGKLKDNEVCFFLNFL